MCARARVNYEKNFDEKLKFSILSLEILGEPLDHPTELFLGTSKISLLELLSRTIPFIRVKQVVGRAPKTTGRLIIRFHSYVRINYIILIISVKTFN